MMEKEEKYNSSVLLFYSQLHLKAGKNALMFYGIMHLYVLSFTISFIPLILNIIIQTDFLYSFYHK
jgi:hypothetical protein